MTINSDPELANYRQICGLDLLRFAAALLVVLHHLIFMASTAAPRQLPPPERLAAFTWAGWIGVEVFFVLSGFVVAYSAERATSWNFTASRLLRLYPAVWLCSSLTAVALFFDRNPLEGQHLLHRWLTTFTLFPVGSMVDSVYWTLKVEMLFYLIILILLLTRSFSHIGVVMSGLGLCSTIGWVYVASLHGGVPTSSCLEHVASYYRGYPLQDRFLLRFAPFFAVGVLLWLCLLRAATVWRLAALALCCIGCVLEIHMHSAWLCVQLGVHFSMAIPLVLWTGSILVIILSTKANDLVLRHLGVRGAKLFRTLGLITYPLYLMHNQVGLIVLRKLNRHAPSGAWTIVVILLMVAASVMVACYVEAPIRRALWKAFGYWTAAGKLRRRAALASQARQADGAESTTVSFQR